MPYVGYGEPSPSKNEDQDDAMHDIYSMLYGRIKLQNANPTYLNLEIKRDGGKLHYMVVNSLFLAITFFTFKAFHFLLKCIPF